MGQRSRKRGRRSRPAVAVTAGARSGRSERPSRSERKDAAARATLTPLRPGERPWPIVIACVIALLIGGGDLIDVLVGGKIRFGNSHAGKGGVIVFSVLMFVCAGGMWKLRYWAVLGFQALLALVIVLFSLVLVRGASFVGSVVALVILVAGGYLFFKLVRVLGRIQMPKYPGR